MDRNVFLWRRVCSNRQVEKRTRTEASTLALSMPSQHRLSKHMLAPGCCRPFKAKTSQNALSSSYRGKQLGLNKPGLLSKAYRVQGATVKVLYSVLPLNAARKLLYATPRGAQGQHLWTCTMCQAVAQASTEQLHCVLTNIAPRVSACAAAQQMSAHANNEDAHTAAQFRQLAESMMKVSGARAPALISFLVCSWLGAPACIPGLHGHQSALLPAWALVHIDRLLAWMCIKSHDASESEASSLSCLMPHGSWFVAHASWLMVPVAHSIRGSWIMPHGSWLATPRATCVQARSRELGSSSST
eukprot:955582-Pelagomonas_calceolata.AAC.2